MLVGLIWLLACQLVGEVMVRLTDAPIPGAVVGMVLLFVVLRWRRTPDSAPVIRAGDYLLSHLQLFFVPAGVGTSVSVTTLEPLARRTPIRASEALDASPSSTAMPAGLACSAVAPFVRRTVISGRCGTARTLSRSSSATS